MLGTLYGRALASRAPRPLLRDEHAERVVEQIDYDFASLGVNTTVITSVALRAAQFDQWTSAFITAHPDAVVLHLACGLDSRVYRVDSPPSVAWFDVDFPEVIALRRRVYPERPGYTMVASSVLDYAWLAQVPEDRPTLIVAEGLSMYLPPREGTDLFKRLVERPPEGELCLDVQSGAAIRLQKLNPVVRRTGATLTWGIDDPYMLPRAIPRLRLLEVLRAYDLAGAERVDLPGTYKFTFWLMRKIPALGNLGLQLRYAF